MNVWLVNPVETVTVTKANMQTHLTKLNYTTALQNMHYRT